MLTEQQRDDCQPWFDNARKLSSLVSELQTLSLQVVEEDDRSRRT